MIYDACQKDVEQTNDGGDNTPSSNDNGSNPNWRLWYDKCVDVSSINDTSIVINQVMNDNNARYRKDLIGDEDWECIFKECQKRRETYDRVQATKGERAFLQKQYEYDYIQRKTGFNVRRKQINQIFGWRERLHYRVYRRNGNIKKLSKLYDEKPLEFEIDTDNPNWVKLIYSKGNTAKVHDKVIYESVLQA